jgi:hypothetical protein
LRDSGQPLEPETLRDARDSHFDSWFGSATSREASGCSVLICRLSRRETDRAINFVPFDDRHGP